MCDSARGVAMPGLSVTIAFEWLSPDALCLNRHIVKLQQGYASNQQDVSSSS